MAVVAYLTIFVPSFRFMQVLVLRVEKREESTEAKKQEDEEESMNK